MKIQDLYSFVIEFLWIGKCYNNRNAIERHNGLTYPSVSSMVSVLVSLFANWLRLTRSQLFSGSDSNAIMQMLIDCLLFACVRFLFFVLPIVGCPQSSIVGHPSSCVASLTANKFADQSCPARHFHLWYSKLISSAVSSVERPQRHWCVATDAEYKPITGNGVFGGGGDRNGVDMYAIATAINIITIILLTITTFIIITFINLLLSWLQIWDFLYFLPSNSIIGPTFMNQSNYLMFGSKSQIEIINNL